MAETWTYTGTLVVKECPSCGITYGVPEDFNRKRSEDGETWYCPRGHRVHYGETDVQRLQKALDQSEHSRTWAQQRHRDECIKRRGVERRLSATQGVVTRTKNRIARGICLCCNKTFADLRKHMTHKHPDYADG